MASDELGPVLHELVRFFETHFDETELRKFALYRLGPDGSAGEPGRTASRSERAQWLVEALFRNERIDDSLFDELVRQRSRSVDKVEAIRGAWARARQKAASVSPLRTRGPARVEPRRNPAPEKNKHMVNDNDSADATDNIDESPLPGTLQRALAEGNVIPFVGAGVSMAVQRVDGSRAFPSWHGLLELAAERLAVEQRPEHAVVSAFLGLTPPSYMDAATNAHKGLRGLWPEFLEETFRIEYEDVEANSLELAQRIWGLGSQIVITTNYDRVLRWACNKPMSVNELIIEAPHTLLSALRGKLRRETIWHLHGSIGEPTSIILSPDGYDQFYTDDAQRSKFGAALTSLRSLMTTHHMLFVGFSLDDPYVLRQLEWVRDTFKGCGGPHYVLARAQNIPAMKARVAGLNVDFIPFENFGAPLLRRLDQMIRSRDPSRAASPPAAKRRVGKPPSALSVRGTGSSSKASAVAYVTARVAAHASPDGEPSAQQQIALRGVDGGTSKDRRRYRIEIQGRSYELIVGDTHAAWWSHQADDEVCQESFRTLFATLCAEPGKRFSIDRVERLDAATGARTREPRSRRAGGRSTSAADDDGDPAPRSSSASEPARSRQRPRGEDVRADPSYQRLTRALRRELSILAEVKLPKETEFPPSHFLSEEIGIYHALALALRADDPARATVDSLVESLIAQPAREVVVALNKVDAALHRSRSSVRMHDLLCVVLPLCFEPGDERLVPGSEFVVEVPVANETLLEVAQARRDRRPCRFVAGARAYQGVSETMRSLLSPREFVGDALVPSPPPIGPQLDSSGFCELVLRDLAVWLGVPTDVPEQQWRDEVSDNLEWRANRDENPEHRQLYFAVRGNDAREQWLVAIHALRESVSALRFIKLQDLEREVARRDNRIMQPLRDLWKRGQG